MSQVQSQSQVLIIGNFDGVHRGHQTLIRAGILLARRLGGGCSLLTFDPHPQAFFSQGKHQRIEPVSRVLEHCQFWGLDEVHVIPFTAELAAMEAETFLNEFLSKRFQVKGLVVGFDFRFGRGRAGGVEILRSWCQSHAVKLEVVSPLDWKGEKISSSRIREVLKQGRVDEVPDLMGRAFAIQGVTQPGAQKGSQLGFPTANLRVEGLVLPADGVYFSRSHLKGKVYWSATHLGAAPTVGREERIVETHLLDYSGGALYGEALSVEFLELIRGVKKFSSLEELKQQIAADLAACQGKVRA